MRPPAAGHAPLPDRSPVLRAGIVSFVIGTAIMTAKFVAWVATDSSAIFADAAESIVNVVAAAVATYSVAVASRPADADHPYGHGKAEPLSAAVEGSLIMVAALAIVVSSVHEIIVGPELRRLGFGMALSGAAGVANLGLGLYLVRVGRREGSEAIAADGVHVMTDVVTTAGALVALALVKITGIVLLDPLAALAVAANILWTGSRVIRRALAALLDEAHFPTLERLAARLQEVHRPEWVEIHQLRYRSSGPLAHVDLHLIVPRYLSIEDAHKIGDALEAELVAFADGTAEVVVHLDPCTPRHCRACTVEPCPVRSAPLEKPFPFDVESLTKTGII